MFAITGVTGQVGGLVASALIDKGLRVRAVMRDALKASPWQARGAEVALAAMDDASALEHAFAEAEAVFVLLPPIFDPSPGFAEARRCIEAVETALRRARPRRVVALSTIGAQAGEENLLSQLGLLESALAALPVPVAFLRAAWFMENAKWDIGLARETGEMPSHLQPLDRPVPMVATADVADVAAGLLQDIWQGRRIVELEGPQRVTPDELAATLSQVIGRHVAAKAIPRASWEAAFKAGGMTHPGPRMRMLDGFNEGWIRFESEARKGRTGLETVLRRLAGASGTS